jgi:hypothetical protein
MGPDGPIFLIRGFWQPDYFQLSMMRGRCRAANGEVILFLTTPNVFRQICSRSRHRKFLRDNKITEVEGADY